MTLRWMTRAIAVSVYRVVFTFRCSDRLWRRDWLMKRMQPGRGGGGKGGAGVRGVSLAPPYI